MASEADYRLLREDIGLAENDLVKLSNEKAAAIYVQAAAEHPASGAAVIFAATRVIAIERIWAKTTDQADYVQNEESEKLGQIAPNKLKLLQRWDAKLAAALAAEEEAANGPVPPPSHSVRLRAVW